MIKQYLSQVFLLKSLYRLESATRPDSYLPTDNFVPRSRNGYYDQAAHRWWEKVEAYNLGYR